MAALARDSLRNGAHLAVLSAVALAQPLFDILGRNPTFFAVRGSSSAEIVLFALVLVFALPLTLVLVELVARVVDPRLSRALHLAFVAALSCVLALYVVTKTGSASGAVAVAAAAATGVAAAALYARTRLVPTLLSVLSPVPLLFLGLFLFGSPVSKLVFADAPAVRAANVDARTPVVLVVFDELSTVGLMDGRQRVDRVRFPNFASLADGATWYRNATTTYWLSEVAVPSILSALNPDPRKLPVASEYPDNLFTLLGGSYRLRVVETLTRVCPRSVCREAITTDTRAVAGDTGSLANDVGIVYLHLVLPEPYIDEVPAIDDAWGNFGDAGGAGEDDDEPVRARRGPIEACGRSVCEFANAITNDPRPTLYFVHSLLPHVPYVYLPSGRRYAIEARPLRGIDNGRWLGTWPMRQGQQRYLLQLAYTDRALGVILRKLRATGIYDRALVIVTADHGVGFRVGDQRRLPTPTNLDEIAFVPLFVKFPNQRRARIVDTLARNVDIVPTIARVLGLAMPWRHDGRPLVGRRAPADGTVTVWKQDRTPVSAPLSRLRELRTRALAAQRGVFGTGPLERVYAIGPRRDLLRRPVRELSVRPSATARVEIDAGTLLEAVDRASTFVPTFVEGRVTGVGPRVPLAVAVNGRIEAMTYTFDQHGQTRFSAFVPERALRDGRNAVDVFAVRGTELEQLRGAEVRYVLGRDDDEQVISGGRRPIGVQPGILAGTVRVVRGANAFTFTGHARDRRSGGRADAIFVFVGDRAVYVGRAENLKPHRILGQPELGRAGFAFELPPALLPPAGGERPVRVLAMRRGVATELRYERAYPWRTR